MKTPWLVPDSFKSADGWQMQAACLGHPYPDLFHPVSYAPDISKALDLCRVCPVIVQCGDFGDELKATGIWGGKLRKGK